MARLTEGGALPSTHNDVLRRLHRRLLARMGHDSGESETRGYRGEPPLGDLAARIMT